MLKDKVILLIGSEGLIGSETKRLLTENRAELICADVEFLENSDQNEKVDITNADSTRNLFESISRKYGRLDGLINNAYPRTNDWGLGLEDISLESWKQNIDFQLNSVFDVCKQAVKLMKPNKSGSIVNMASIYGVLGNDFDLYENTSVQPPAPYPAIKGGVISFSRYMASYCGSMGIRVNCVSPGGVFNHQDDNFVERYSKKVPLGRMAKPVEIASVIKFLLSDEAAYITGQNIIVDGGYTIT